MFVHYALIRMIDRLKRFFEGNESKEKGEILEDY